MDYFTLPVERSGQLGLSVSFYGSMKNPLMMDVYLYIWCEYMKFKYLNCGIFQAFLATT